MKNSVRYIKSILSAILVIVGIALGIFIGIKFVRFFMPFVIGWFIALIANPLVRFAESKMKLVRKHTSMLLIILVLGLIVGGGYLVGAKLVEETANLVSQAPELYQGLNEDFREAGKTLDRFVQELPDDVQSSIAEIQTSIISQIGNFVSGLSGWTVSSASGFAKNIPSVLISIIFTILSAYFFITDRDLILEFGRANTPMFIQRNWKVLADNFRAVIGGYFKAQFKIMALVWLILSVGFLFLGIKFAVLIAFLVSFLDMLPFFGTGTALIPWALFKLLSGDIKIAVGLVILYIITQLMRRVLEPKLVGDSIGLNPLWALIFMYIGYKLASVLGMIIAVPIGAIVINFYKMGTFDGVIATCKAVMGDFMHWLRPKEKE